MNFFKQNKTLTIVLAVVLAVVIAVSGGIGIFAAVTAGKKVNVEEEVNKYNTSKPDFSYLFTGTPESVMSTQLDLLDTQLNGLVGSLNVEGIAYTDKVATVLVKFIAQLVKKELTDIKFNPMKKEFRAAYDYLKSQQDAGKTWADITEIPFGITAGDKAMFIKACGAGTAHLGNDLLKVILYAPTAYNECLVPALESLHTGAMPSFFGFIFETGLSGKKRMEFLIEKVLSIVEPTKEKPLAYLCGMLPDFLINYSKASEFINSNEKITTKVNLTMPTVDSVLSQVFTALGMSTPTLDKELLKKAGTASIGESGGRGKQRVTVNGDREVVFALLADYITGSLVFENNFATVDKILTQDLKSDAVTQSSFSSLLTQESSKAMIANLMDCVAKLKSAPQEDINAAVEAYNAETKDYSSLFTWPATEENVTSVLDSLDSTLASALAEADLESVIFTDEIATMVSKLTAEIAGRELSEITFSALSKSFPEAYTYVSGLKAEGKTWDEIGVIPFGITAGDREMFVKACGAGAEHFGDVLALSLLASPTAYDETLLPLLESLHTGPMPNLNGFIASAGLDSAKRMEEITEKVLTILEPIKKAPLTYLCTMLPDLIASYNHASQFIANDPHVASKVGLVLPPISELLGDLVGSFGIILPEYDFSNFEKMATAAAVESGDACGLRMELTGDREVVFMSVASYIIQVVKLEGNLQAIFTLVTENLNLDSSLVTTLITAIESLGITESLTADANSSTEMTPV